MRQVVTTYHVEIDAPEELVPAAPASTRHELVQAEIPLPELNRFLYATVGADWCWHMRLNWSHTDWREYLERAALGTWIAWVRGTPAGYFELERQPPGSVEIAYFGLLPQFVGKGMGGALLTDAVRTAWAFGVGSDGSVPRVWLHTCSLDHPAALPNYQARGFRIFDTVESIDELPDQPLEPWPGAGSRDGG